MANNYGVPILDFKSRAISRAASSRKDPKILKSILWKLGEFRARNGTLNRQRRAPVGRLPEPEQQHQRVSAGAAPTRTACARPLRLTKHKTIPWSLPTPRTSAPRHQKALAPNAS